MLKQLLHQNFFDDLGSNYMIADLTPPRLFIMKVKVINLILQFKKSKMLDAILLVGSNPRWEASVLNARIKSIHK